MTHRALLVTSIDGTDMSAELEHFAAFFGLKRIAPGRYSMLLVLELFVGFKSNRLNPAKVLREIQILEGVGGQSRLKPPSMFGHLPLKGLWHKHYLEDGLAAMALNLNKGLHRYGLPLIKQRIRKAQETSVERYFSIEDCIAIAEDAVWGNWSQLGNAQALTGEWIIYAQHEGANYYLCLGKHDSGDNNIRARIDALCCHEFPFLQTMLA